jgi:hypothetical protein
MYVYPNRLAYLHRHYCQCEEAGVMESEKTDKQSRKEAGLTREKAIEEAQRVAEAKRAENRAAEEAEQLARERARKEAWLAKEKAIEEERKARKARESEKLDKR